ncbi:TPA: hypothetical protein JRS12_001493 [Escherichia coli]|nr:hypothetical protein [Escherichia coli]HAY3747930.1 hypothetical protein [Escherichia coli]HAY3752778.1 hypothetical protein [Escherichia coli]
MAINSPLNIAAQPGKTRLRKSLKLWQVVMMGLAYLTPMTVFDTFGIVSGISDGHVPASYLLALAGVLTVGVLWINLEATSLTLGLVWASLGGAYLWYLIRRYRKVPLYEGDRTPVSET